MTAVARVSAHLSSIQCPRELREVPGWLMWRLEYHEGEDKPRKVPYYASGRRRQGVQGSPADRQELVTFEAARSAAARRGFDGVGLALMPDWGVTALDFDHCMVDGRLHPEVAAIAATGYAEWSPSGQGVRVLLRGNLGNRKSLDPAYPYGFETFSTKGFVTFTGNRLPITDALGNADALEPVAPEVEALVHRRFPAVEANPTGHDDPVLGLTSAHLERALEVLDPSMGHDDWLQVGMALHHETRGEGFDLWADWSAQSDKFPGRDILRHRWDSFGQHQGPVVTARSLVRMANEHGAGLPGGAPGPASAEEFEVIVAEAQAAAKPPRFAFEPISTFASVTAAPWLIKGVLAQAGLGVIYGASRSGKSFVALDMAMAIARGVEWRGRRTRQCRVAYVAAEGADGFRKRLAAYGQDKGLDLSTVPMVVLNGAPNLMEVQDTKDLVLGVRAAGGADVIIVDTFAQVMPGANENAGEDVGKALGHCRRIHEATGAMVVLIHHSGKDAAKGARGWSGLQAAADSELEVVRDGDLRTLRLTKSKDGVDGLEWGFQLRVVELGVDEDLEPITSCVVEEADLKAPRILRALGPNEEVVNAVIQEMAQVQTAGIEVRAVVAEAVARMPAPVDGKRDTRKQRAMRAIETLCRGDDAPYWLGDDGCISVM